MGQVPPLGLPALGGAPVVAVICPHCGGEAELDVLELYLTERSALLEACCEAAHDDAVEQLHEDPRGFAAWVGERTGFPIRAAHADMDAAGRYGNGGVTLDFNLALVPIEWREAAAWIGTHHRHNRAPAGWRWGHGVRNGLELVGVATVGRPSARMLDASAIAEVTRVCIDPGLPAYLVRNACSMLYGAAAREAERRGLQRLITYTREGEAATSVVAAGFVATHVVKVDRRGWARAGRPRAAEERCRKLRWERGLTAAARRDVDARALAREPVDAISQRRATPASRMSLGSIRSVGSGGT